MLDRAHVCRLMPSDVGTDRLSAALSALRDEVADVHCDLDVLHPSVGRANPFPVPGGLGLASLQSALHAIGQRMPIAAAAVTSYAPEYDEDDRMSRAALQVVDAIIAAARPGWWTTPAICRVSSFNTRKPNERKRRPRQMRELDSKAYHRACA